MSSLKVNTNDTVAEVMSLIKEKENIECDIQLHFMGNILLKESSLSEIGISQDSTIMLIRRQSLRSGKICSDCKKEFDDIECIPRMIPSCYHSYCSSCIDKFSVRTDSGCALTCPQDGSVCTLAACSRAPKNFIILDAITKIKPVVEVVMCDSCEEPHPATFCCHECNENMCDLPISLKQLI